MDPPPAFRFPAPLLPLSPERVNGTRPLSSLSTTTPTKTSKTSDTESQYQPPEFSSNHSSPTRKANLFADYHPTTPTASSTRGFALPQSPSLPEIHALRNHVRTNSDVQGLVKRFEHLDVRDKDAESAERRKKHEAELRRAQIAREEAESDVKRLREELRRMKKEGEEGRERERKVGRRLEVVMEEYANAKETYASQHAIYEKELRRARKEAFKSSSAVLKLQEELKSTRNSLRITQSGFDIEKQKVQRREQETFNAQYQLAAIQEELDKLRAHLKIVEEEREALKTNLKEEEVARIAAEGMIALPASKGDDDDLFGSSRVNSPLKRAPSPLSDDKENIGAVSRKMLESKCLEEELLREQTKREHAEEMIEFLSLECKFRCCSCQTASRRDQDHSLSISGDLATTLDMLMEGMKSVLTPPGDLHQAERMELDSGPDVQSETLEAEQVAQTDFETVMCEETAAAPETEMTEEDDRSMTMTAEEPAEQPNVEDEAPIAPHPTPAEPEPQAETIDPATAVPAQPSSPQTPVPSHHQHRPHAIRTLTTTTTVPMHFTPISKPHSLNTDVEDAQNIPPHLDSATATPTFDRAAALAAIEYRRGRAKSIATGHMTPRKQMLEGINVKERRDISAPALGGKTGGMGLAKGTGSVGRAGGRRMV